MSGLEISDDLGCPFYDDCHYDVDSKDDSEYVETNEENMGIMCSSVLDMNACINLPIVDYH